MKSKTTLRLLLLICLLPLSMVAQVTYDWLDTAPDANFTLGAVGNRWSGGYSTQPPANGILRFNNNHQLTMNNNISPNQYNLHGFVFDVNNTSNRQINRSTNRLFRFFNFIGTSPFITNNSTGTHTFSLPIEGDGNVAYPLQINVNSGDLIFLQTINNRGSAININGTNQVTFSQVISGSGGFNINDGSIVDFAVGNTFTGNTVIRNGELRSSANGNSIAANNLLRIGNATFPSEVAKFYISRTTGATFSRNLIVNQGNANTRYIGSSNSSGTAIFTGIITHNTSTTLNIESQNAGLLRIDGNISGIGSVSYNNGLVEVRNNKTYTGSTIFSGGVVRKGSNNDIIPNSSAVVFAGGTFKTGVTTGYSETAGTCKLTENSTIDLVTGNHTLTFANSSAIVWDLTKTLTITGFQGANSFSGGKIQVGVGGLTPGQLARINFDGFGLGAIITSTGSLAPATVITYDWLDTAPDNLFTQGIVGARWSGGFSTQPPMDGVLRFDNNHQLTMNSNTSPNQFSLHGFVFEVNNTSNRRINRSTSRIFRFYNYGGANPYISNNSIGTHTFNLPIEGDGNVAYPLQINVNSGNLVFLQTINNHGSAINVNGAYQATFSQAISGSGGFTINNGAIVDFVAGNSFTGNTVIRNGELRNSANGNTISGNNRLRIGNATFPNEIAKFYISRAAGAVFQRTFIINQGNANTRYIGSTNSSGIATFSGIITHNTNTILNIESLNAGLLRIDGNISGIGSVAYNNGLVEVINNKTYAGSTIFAGGIMRKGNGSDIIPNASPVIFAGGTFRTGVTTGGSETAGTIQLTGNSGIDLATGNHTLTFANSSAVVWDLTKTLTITGFEGVNNTTSGKIQVGVGGLTTAQLARINFDGFGSGAIITSSGFLSPANARIYDWLDTAPDNLFTQGVVGARWSGGFSTQPPSDGVLRFDNNHQVTMTNNISANQYNLHGFIFDVNNTTNRTINRSTTSKTFRLYNYGGTNPFITNNSTGNHTFNVPITGDGNASYPLQINLNSGNLTFLQTINNAGGAIDINGTNQVTFSQAISGAGGMNINDGAIVDFTIVHPYTGNTVIRNGELRSTASGNTISANNRLRVGIAAYPSEVAKFYLTRPAGANFSRSFIVNQGNANTRYIGSTNSSGVSYFSGIITHNTNTILNIESLGAGILSIDGNISGIGSVSYNGGIVEVRNNKTYTGSTILAGGIMRKSSSTDIIPNSSQVVFAGGTYRTGVTTGFSETAGTFKLTENSIIDLATGNHTLTFANSSAVTWDLTKTLTITGYLGLTGNVGKIQVGVGGLTSAQLARITFDGLDPGAIITATGQLAPAVLTTFYSTGSTSPHLLASWNSETDGSGDTPLTFNIAANYVVQSGHNMVNTATWTNSAAGSKLTVSSGASLRTTAAIILSSTSLFTLEANATYIHDNSSAFLTSIFAGSTNFNAASTAEYRNWATTGPNVSIYGNLIFNSTVATNDLVFNGAITNVAGDFTVLATGPTTRTIYLISSSGVDTTLNIGGDLSITGGRLSLTNGSRDITLNVSGSLDLDGGQLYLGDNSSGGQGTINVTGDTALTSGTFRFDSNTTAGGGYLIMNGSNISFGQALVFSTNVPNNGSGFYANHTGVVNLVSSNSFSASSIRDRFYYKAGNVTQINETFNATVAQFTVSGASSTPLPGYSPWPTTGNKINDFIVNNPVSLTLNNSKVVNGTLNLQSGDVILGNNALTYQGTSFLKTSGQINASGTSATLVFNNSALLTLPSSLFNGSIRNLTISGNGGIKANQDLSVLGVLNLSGTNPNATDGVLDMVISYGSYASADSADSTDAVNDLNSHILTMGSAATTTGAGDVTGKILRNSFSGNVAYTFGNRYMRITFNNTGTRPSEMLVVATRGDYGLHNAKGDAVKRLYQILRTGGSSTNLANIRLPYEDAVLNGNTESDLVIWSHVIPFAGSSPFEQGASSQNSTQNWVQLNGQGIFTFTLNGDIANTKYWTVSDQLSTNVKWLGTVSTSWNDAANWSSATVPDATVSVLIPPSAEYNNALTISGTLNVKTIRISETAVVNSASGATLYIHGGPSDSNSLNSWNNEGTFNRSTSTIRFNSTDATIAGNTDFYNLRVETGKTLTITSDTEIGIYNAITNNGVIDATSNENTISFRSGGTQTIVQPNGTIPGFYNLTINKTAGDANQSGPIDIYGTLNLVNRNFNIGTNTIRLFGPYITGNVNLFRAVTTSDIEYRNSGTGTVNLTNDADVRNLTFSSDLTYNLVVSPIVRGNLFIENATINTGNFNINRATNGGTLTLGDNAVFRRGSNIAFPTNYATHVISQLSTVEYYGSSQTVSNLNSSQSYGNLILAGSGNKNMTALTSGISGDFTLGGTAVALLPTNIKFDGDFTQEIEGLNYQNINFSGNGLKSFTNDASIGPDNLITFGAGAGTVDFDGDLNDFEFTLNSNASSTSIVGDAGSFTLTGKVRAERYIPSLRAYRFLTSSVNTATSINANWQENQANPDTATNSNDNPGFGIHITGAGGDANGFDVNTTSTASMFGYNNFSQTWNAITNTNVNTLTAGTPYRILIRGDRSINLLSNSAPSTPTTMRALGTLSFGNQVVSNTIDPGFAGLPYVFVGNPYHAPVNMQGVLSTATDLNPNFMYVWDAQLGTRGGYTTINVVTNTSSAGGGANRYLQIGQAVFVEATGSNPSMTFTESDKYTSTNESMFKINEEENPTSMLKIQLFESNNYAIGARSVDGLVIDFNNLYSNNVNGFDARKLNNLDEEFSSKVNDTLLSYQSRNFPTTNNEFIQLNNAKYRSQNYAITVDFDAIPNMNTYLLDQFTGEQVLLENNQTTVYNFSVDSTVGGSIANDRFRIIFEENDVLSNDIVDISDEVVLYPNPNNGQFSIKLPSFDQASIQIFNNLGQEVYQKQVDEYQSLIQIDASVELAAGAYIIHIVLDETKVVKQFIVK
uniref:T9SS type A sorting domain-containing protein n=1 Tax=Flavobacterium sp. TaxID=239 RepID=UPI004049054D